MEYILLPLIACIGSLLTFFTGFGLGTILLPIFALFFPLPLAIALTTTVHLLNNLFKFFLIGKYTDWKIVLHFGIPALLASFLGAAVLIIFTHFPAIMHYTILGVTYEILPLNLMIGGLLIFFATLDLISLPTFKFQKSYLWLGGLLSGFFGGLSGFQGAFRSLFLINYPLTKEQFIATGVVIACFVDIARLPTYGISFSHTVFTEHTLLLTITIISAFAGAYIGNQFLKKITMPTVKTVVAAFIYFMAAGLIFGIV